MACAPALPTLSPSAYADKIIPPTTLADGRGVRLPYKHVRQYHAHENKNGIHHGMAQGSPAFMLCSGISSVDQGRATRGVRHAITFATRRTNVFPVVMLGRRDDDGGDCCGEHMGSIEGASTRPLSAAVRASSTTAETTVGSTQPHGRRYPFFKSPFESTAVESDSVRPTRQQPRVLAAASSTASDSPDALLPPHAAGYTPAVVTSA
ncbi:unnamed protein product, partial [Sphacelaria rigidula]